MALELAAQGAMLLNHGVMPLKFAPGRNALKRRTELRMRNSTLDHPVLPAGNAPCGG